MVEATFAAFGVVALLLFFVTTPRVAVAATCFAGWLLLPVGHFPPGSSAAEFPYWITGTAVPSDMLLTKIWWPPVIALFGSLLRDRKNLLRGRPGWTDLPMLLWCLWPLGQWPLVAYSEPESWIASLYLFAAWGVPWLLGRVYFSGADGGAQLLKTIVAGLVVLTPIALIEGFFGPRFYDWVYELHPFRTDGIERYFGFRPLGFFEHGNQYGIWIAITSFAAIWLWRRNPTSRRNFCAALLGIGLTLLSQSAGALVLLLAGVVMMWTHGLNFVRRATWAVSLLAIVLAAIYFSGVVPFRSIATNTAIGRQIVDIVRSTGRISVAWRIARDQDALPTIAQHPLVGTGQWNWWREFQGRPWSLGMLIAGQFGLIGCALAFGAVLIPALRAWTNLQRRAARSSRDSVAAPLAIIVFMACGDGLFNSFPFYPFILAAGALCDNRRASETRRAGQPTEYADDPPRLRSPAV